LIDLDQDHALLDFAPLVDVDLAHDSGDFRAQGYHRPFHTGIIGIDVRHGVNPVLDAVLRPDHDPDGQKEDGNQQPPVAQDAPEPLNH
jgi:hypothetical protein